MYSMDAKEFIYLYLNASEEVQKRVRELLGVEDSQETESTQ